MDVRNLPLASDSLVGFDYGINNWIFADFSYKPSYWLALKRESFAQYSTNPFELIDAVFYRLSFEQMLSIYRLHDTPYPAARSWSKYTAREKLQSLIMNGHIQAFCVTDKVALRMANYFDPILHPPGASFSQNTGNPLVDKRNELAEMLGKDILNRWLGKVEADRAHFARWAVTQDLVEAWDFGVTAVDTVVDIIVGLADTAVFIVDVMEDEFTFHLKVNTALVKSAGHALTGEQEAAREALRQAGIVIGEKVKTQQEFMTEIAKKAQQGLNMLMRLYNDPLSRMLLFDFFDSLYKSQPYREQKNLKTRISIEIGVEVLLAIFTAGTASVAKRAGQAAASSARVAKVVSKAKRIGPFTAEAIDLIADISKLLDKTSMKSEKGKEVAVGVVPVDNVKKSTPNSMAPSKTKSDLLGGNGKFKDSDLEDKYQKYLERKNKQGKDPRGREEWKKERDYWLNDSPMARGNQFNKTVEKSGKYPYSEVHLGNGKRLDSYDPYKGEIVSRKATDLENIDKSTFKSYLKEMQEKYKPGTSINSPKYGEKLKGQVLKGKQILEIPDTNKNFIDIQKYKGIAKEYGIEIRFTPE